MKTLFMTRGLPASGKTTWAKQKLHDVGVGNAKRVNKDDLRSMLDDSKWSPENEKYLLGVRDYVVTTALNAGLHVIVDDTNLPPKHEARLRQIAKPLGAEFELVDFTHVGLEECIERDRKRQNYVGEKVIRGMWDQFLRPASTSPAYDPTLPWVILCDIDGTLAQMNGRGPYDWSRVEEDEPRIEVWHAAVGIRAQRGDLIIFVSGRDESCRTETTRWIDSRLQYRNPTLYMRPAGDMRKDTVVKREIYEAHIKGKYNVRAIFDDRPQVIRLWQELGFADRIFNVGDGREF